MEVEKQELKESIKKAIDKFEKETKLKLQGISFNIEETKVTNGYKELVVNRKIDIDLIITI